jgi:ADP-ribosylglycohydrolase
MLGAIIGDIVGSIYEFENHKSKDFPLFGEFSAFTDDSLCTIAVADCLMNDGDPAAYLRMWGQKYWKLGYGNHYRRWLKRDDLGPYESYGNGAAMRVSPAAFLAASLEQARQQAIRVTEVTHNHSEGIKGALATVDAIWMAFDGAAPEIIRAHIAVTYGYDMQRTCDMIRPGYEFNESCQGTVPEAIICALEAADFEDAIRNAISIGGDSDTVGAIAGSIAEARFGIPPHLVNEAMNRLTDELRAVVVTMYDTARKCRPTSTDFPSP